VVESDRDEVMRFARAFEPEHPGSGDGA